MTKVLPKHLPFDRITLPCSENSPDDVMFLVNPDGSLMVECNENFEDDDETNSSAVVLSRDSALKLALWLMREVKLLSGMPLTDMIGQDKTTSVDLGGRFSVRCQRNDSKDDCCWMIYYRGKHVDCWADEFEQRPVRIDGLTSCASITGAIQEAQRLAYRAGWVKEEDRPETRKQPQGCPSSS